MIKYFLFLMVMTGVVNATENLNFAEIARLRQYSCGADESDLRVQTVLNTSQNKKKKQISTDPIEGF